MHPAPTGADHRSALRSQPAPVLPPALTLAVACRSNELTKAEKIVAILESWDGSSGFPVPPGRPSGAAQQPYLYAAAAQPPAPAALVVEEPEVRVLS